MIEKVEINNFRSHEKTTLTFAKGINVIVGMPDSGKTNVIRSINWALTNRPLGFRFHSDTAKGSDTSVKVTFDDGFIELVKNKKASSYTSSEDDDLKAIGSDVPSSIRALADMTELNMQRQLDQHFLICASPSEVAKVFNRITRLEKIDRSISLATTDINTENKNIKNLEGQASVIIEKIKDMGDVDKMVEASKEISMLDDSIEDHMKELNDLEATIDLCIESKAEMDKYKLLPKMMEFFDDIIELNDDLNSYQSKSIALSDIMKDIVEVGTILDNLEFIGSSVKDDFLNIEEQWNDFRDAEKNFITLEETIDKIMVADNGIKKIEKAMDDELEKYKAFLKTIKTCPFCEKCTTKLQDHDFNLFLKEFER